MCSDSSYLGIKIKGITKAIANWATDNNFKFTIYIQNK